jgi:uroporphyrinogen decarboxylase
VARSFEDSDFVLVNNKALSNISEKGSYELPDFSTFEDYRAAVEAKTKNKDKWLIGEMPSLTFSIANKIFGLENYFAALVLERERAKILYNKIDALIEHIIRNYAKAGVDWVMFTEDWVT